MTKEEVIKWFKNSPFMTPTHTPFLMAIKALEQPEIVRCKYCKHRPIKPDCYENGFDLEFPDGKCPCECSDGWYSWFPSDEWFCANGELKD